MRRKRSQVIGPDGAPLSIVSLPPPGMKRWVVTRKMEVVAAVRGGIISLDEACKRYEISLEEFLSWQEAIDREGIKGLRTKQIQQRRRL